jgi:hypothetical protein
VVIPHWASHGLKGDERKEREETIVLESRKEVGKVEFRTEV